MKLRVVASVLVLLLASAALALWVGDDRSTVRPTARVVELVEVRPNNVQWAAIEPWGDAILAVGQRASPAVLVTALFAKRGSAALGSELANVSCAHSLGLVSLTPQRALAYCMFDGGLAWFSISADLSMAPLGKVSGFDETQVVLVTAEAEKHFWLVKHLTRGWMLGVGRSFEVPTFVSVAPRCQPRSIAYSTDGELIVVTDEPGQVLGLSVWDVSGAERAYAAVAASGPRSGAAQVLTVGKEAAVLWVEQQTGFGGKLLAPFTSPKTRLRFQRFSVNPFAPLEEPRDVTTDEQVVPFDVYRVDGGDSIVAWDQGVRGPWTMASYVQFKDPAALASADAVRIPAGILPADVVATARGAVLLTWSASQQRRPVTDTPDRIVVLEHPVK